MKLKTFSSLNDLENVSMPSSKVMDDILIISSSSAFSCEHVSELLEGTF